MLTRGAMVVIALAAVVLTAGSVPSPYVKTCGMRLCVGSSAFVPYGASTYHGFDDPTARANLAVQAHLNLVRVVNFLDEHANAPYDSARWAKVDAAIAAAHTAGLHVLLDLSTYRNLLRNNNVNPYLTDWKPFVTFVGQRYKNNPTVAIIAIAGEVPPLNTPGPLLPTTQQLTDFYRRTIGELKAADPNHLVSEGGLLQLSWNSGIDWKAIFSIAGNDVPAIHVYSTNDETKTIPAVSTYAAQIGKPWLVEEFGFKQTLGDATRAADFQRVYDESRSAVGVLFWNLGTEVVGVNGKTETYDVNPNTPKTWATVQRNARN